MDFNYIKVGYCTLKTDTQGVHPTKLKLTKLQVSQDTNVELRSFPHQRNHPLTCFSIAS